MFRELEYYLESLIVIKTVKAGLINQIQKSTTNPAVVSVKALYPKKHPAYPAEARAICDDVADFFKIQGFPVEHRFYNNAGLDCSIKF